MSGGRQFQTCDEVSLKFGLIKGWASVTWTWKQQPPSVWPHGRLVNRSIFMRWWNGPLVVLKAKWDVICAHYLASRVNAIICKRERCSTRKNKNNKRDACHQNHISRRDELSTYAILANPFSWSVNTQTTNWTLTSVVNNASGYP
jgi:hypothetical protein